MTNFRIGIGHDTHRLIRNRPLILGSIFIPYDFGLEGHSDADVVLHALTDALLGAAGFGDIGEFFPNTSMQWLNVDSRIFVLEAMKQLKNSGWLIGNVDVIIHAESPKLSAYKPAITEALAVLLEIATSQINIKAKTGEKLDSIGRQESMQCHVIVLIFKN